MEGLAAQFARIPITQTPRGGVESGVTGVTIGALTDDAPPDVQPEDMAQQPDQFAGMGPILENDDAEVFDETNAMVLRQELLAINRWNIDEYYKCVVDGYPWASLIHDTKRDVYTFELPYGVSSLSIQPVPNKNLDLVNKTSEQLLVDFPEADAEPMDDSEEAEQAAEMANRFLAEDGGEEGTNDAVLWDDRVKLSLVCASSFVEYWVDPSGGGYVPLQIEAHPEAIDPANPEVGPDGNPTTDLVLRYVTGPIQDGKPGAGSQFTNDPTQAAPQWLPKIRTSKWAREHIRTYPEHLPADLAEQVIVLGYCTIGEAKKRWQSVAAMAPEDLSALCDWTPTRYLVLLPPFQRARWKLTDGKLKNKGGASDERIMFYYHRYIKACPDYPKGADVVMSGIDGGQILDKRLLSVDVPVKTGQTSDVTETRCREIPIVQVTPRGDPYGQDPTGRCYMSLFVGATENNAVLAQGFSDGLRKTLTQPWAIPGTSPIEGWQVEEARATGDFLIIKNPNDKPTQLPPPVLPNNFFEMYNLSDEAINSIASRERAASGADNAKERSGKALQIAVSQNNIGNSSMLTATNNSYARGSRIKIELAMSEYTTAQQVSYVGEDGANQVADLHAKDFALVGKVSIKAGTGTGLTQDGKVQYLANLKAEGFVPAEEAMESARPAFAKRLGLPQNPFAQYVSRCVDAWLQGPPAPQVDPSTGQPVIDPATGQPKPDWKAQYRAWVTAQTQYEQAQAQYTQALQQHQQYVLAQATANAGPPSGTLGPEQQTEKAGIDYNQAVIALQTMTAQNPGIATPPVPPVPPQVPKPWVPFSPRPNDTEPELSLLWRRALSKLMSSVNYEKFGAEWKDVLDRQYAIVRQAAAIGSGANPPAQGRSSGASQAPTPQTGQTQPTQPQQANQSKPSLPAGA